jgi:hypothetical protein
MKRGVNDAVAANGAFETIQDIAFPKLSILEINARRHLVI